MVFFFISGELVHEKGTFAKVACKLCWMFERYRIGWYVSGRPTEALLSISLSYLNISSKLLSFVSVYPNDGAKMINYIIVCAGHRFETKDPICSVNWRSSSSDFDKSNSTDGWRDSNANKLDLVIVRVKNTCEKAEIFF